VSVSSEVRRWCFYRWLSGLFLDLPNDVAFNVWQSLFMPIFVQFLWKCEWVLVLRISFLRAWKEKLKLVWDHRFLFYTEGSGWLLERRMPSRNNPAEIGYGWVLFGYSKSYSVSCFIGDNNFFYENYVSSSQSMERHTMHVVWPLIGTLTGMGRRIMMYHEATESQTGNVLLYLP
jgi:hypothetical protein